MNNIGSGSDDGTRKVADSSSAPCTDSTPACLSDLIHPPFGSGSDGRRHQKGRRFLLLLPRGGRGRQGSLLILRAQGRSLPSFDMNIPFPTDTSVDPVHPVAQRTPHVRDSALPPSLHMSLRSRLPASGWRAGRARGFTIPCAPPLTSINPTILSLLICLRGFICRARTK